MAIDFSQYDVIRYIPKMTSSPSDWINWHKLLKNRFGKDQANLLWLKAWQMRAGKGSDASTTDLRTYMEGNGVNLETTALEGLADKMKGLGGFFSSLATGFGIMLTIVIAIPVLIVIVIIYNAVKNPKQAAMIVANATPQGRALNVASGVIGKKK